MKKTKSRRRFIKTTSLGSMGIITVPQILRPRRDFDSKINGVQIGAITYSYRSMPDQDIESILKYVIESGINAVELMGDPAELFAGRPASPVDRRTYFGLIRARRQGDLSDDQKRALRELEAQTAAHNKNVATWRASASMAKFQQIRQMYNDKGVKIYGFKPSTFRVDNSDAEVTYGLRAARALGASHVTLEHPGDDAQTLRLSKLARKNKVRVAYHGHTQQTPSFWDVALKQSKYNAMNIDIGHYVAAGDFDPLAILKEKHRRISSMHLKDRHNKANGQANKPWGQGDTPIREILQLMRDRKYKFPGSIELEYEIPDGSDAVREVQKCLEYARSALQ